MLLKVAVGAGAEGPEARRYFQRCIEGTAYLDLGTAAVLTRKRRDIHSTVHTYIHVHSTWHLGRVRPTAVPPFPCSWHVRLD